MKHKASVCDPRAAAYKVIAFLTCFFMSLFEFPPNAVLTCVGVTPLRQKLLLSRHWCDFVVNAKAVLGAVNPSSLSFAARLGSPLTC